MLLVAVVPAVVVVVAVAIAAFVCKGHAMTSASACCLGPLLSAGSWIALGAVTVGSLAPAKHRTSDQSLSMEPRDKRRFSGSLCCMGSLIGHDLTNR